MAEPGTFPQLPVKPLDGYRILIVEDEYLIAWDIQEMMVEAGAEPFRPVPCVADALRMVALMSVLIDAALLDVNLQGEMAWPVADLLLSHGVPVVLTTAYDPDTLPRAYAHLPRCQKPASKHELVQALKTVLSDPVMRMN